jgi:hypothetical protein
VFAIESRDLARGLPIYGALFQIRAFISGNFALPDTKLGFEFSVFPIELQHHEGAPGHLRFAVKLVDLLPM